MGLVTYVALAVLAAGRSLKGLKDVEAMVWSGYILSAIGTAFSLYLQYQSITVIKATCPWCVASAVIMVLNLIGYAMLSQSLETSPPSGTEFRKLDSYLLIGMPLLTILMTATVILNPAPEAGVTSTIPSGPADPNAIKFLIPEKGNSIGPKDAAVTVVEFADLQCAACQNAGPKLKKFREEFPDKMRIIYRHFPLSMHAFGTPSAAASEYAAEKGKFWEFAMATMGQHKEFTTPDELYAVAQSVGLDVADLQKRIKNVNDPIYKRVTADMAAGDRIGVQLTPTFFIIANGEIEVANQTQLFQKLASDKYQALLTGEPAPATQ